MHMHSHLLKYECFSINPLHSYALRGVLHIMRWPVDSKYCKATVFLAASASTHTSEVTELQYNPPAPLGPPGCWGSCVQVCRCSTWATSAQKTTSITYANSRSTALSGRYNRLSPQRQKKLQQHTTTIISTECANIGAAKRPQLLCCVFVCSPWGLILCGDFWFVKIFHVL